MTNSEKLGLTVMLIAGRAADIPTNPDWLKAFWIIMLMLGMMVFLVGGEKRE